MQVDTRNERLNGCRYVLGNSSISCGATQSELVLESYYDAWLQVVRNAKASSSDSTHVLVPLIQYPKHVFESTGKKLSSAPFINIIQVKYVTELLTSIFLVYGWWVTIVGIILCTVLPKCPSSVKCIGRRKKRMVMVEMEPDLLWSWSCCSDQLVRIVGQWSTTSVTNLKGHKRVEYIIGWPNSNKKWAVEYWKG